jgi:hypothetical protein
MVQIRKFLIGIGMIPNTTLQSTQLGELEVLSTDSNLYFNNGTSAEPVLTATNTVTVTNKSINGNNNTITNIPASGVTGEVLVANGGTGDSSFNANQVIIGGTTSTGALQQVAAGSSGQVLTSNGSSAPTWGTAGTGSVSSVGFSVPASSIFGETGSPITTSGNIALTTTGTSGGIPYFSSASQLSSSADLTAGQIVIGGGAGSAPSTLAPGSNGNLLTIVGGVPTYTAPVVSGNLNAKFTLSDEIVPYITVDGPHFQTNTLSLSTVNMSMVDSGTSGSTTIQVNQYRSGALHNSATASLAASGGLPAGASSALSGTLSLLLGDIITVDVISIASTGTPSDLSVEY